MLDIERLKMDLIDYYGTAMTNGWRMAEFDISDIQNASPEELIRIAGKCGFNINDYIEEFER